MTQPEFYTRDSDKKRFEYVKQMDVGEHSIWYLKPIDENPMPEAKLGDYLVYEYDGKREFNYVTSMKEVEVLEKTPGLVRVVHYRDGKLLWEAKK